MDSIAAHELIRQVGDIRHRARGDRRATSVPLLAFGTITLVDALLRGVVGPGANLLLVLLLPAGFVFVALYYRRRENTVGVGGRTRPYVIAAVVTILCLPVVALFGVYDIVGVGLLVIALTQRNVYLAVWAVVYGVLGGLEAFFVLSNRLYDLSNALGLFRAQNGYFAWAPSLVYGGLGLLLIGAGLHAQRSEGGHHREIALT